ncbi:RagB/SusD family nutrient uptake outer membrane protein [Chryseolinea lacunae]|uniref:RagB/SusD family nutrient uptake outer membrane protein n=1 Tax=Chryseolinea lacunae TaxID=2801331 RepID=A0ABS1KU60_9BACT|nr:RagB/SusD family nutrient uptake outer membrane protein [Chryseolinea lacunae]MBL0742996.1 RagB/SusD family nutrient uptake outer membrane protein [Chryseolinea lacunae]
MRKYAIWIFALVALASCGDYLDIKPQSEVDRESLFQTEEGFLEALNGVYSRCIKPELYGNELTFGFLDVMAQNYDVVDVTNTLFPYEQTAQYNYKDKDFVKRRDAAWIGLYGAIGNCNLILENIDARENIFTGDNYLIVKGEALALRGYLHLDLLRMFAPSYAVGPTAESIPYVTRYSNKVVQKVTVAAALDSILADLNNAKDLLRSSDPILNGAYVVGYTFDGDDGNTLPDDGSNEEAGALFLRNRRHRLNFYGVCGALARAYLYKGDKENALTNAETVIASKKFPWTEPNDFAAVDEAKKDRILYKELIFGWEIPNYTGALSDRFQRGSIGLTLKQNSCDFIYEVAAEGAEDLRYKQWFKFASQGTTVSLEKYKRSNDGNMHTIMAPAIRLSEMYYIAAECVFNSDSERAWRYFNEVRLNRGIGGLYEIHGEYDPEFFYTKLSKEYRKELFAEGQLFYFYKRLNRPVINQSGTETYGPSSQIFVLPLPDDEIQFSGN